MNVQKKITCMIAGITILFFCSVLGSRYYLIYTNLNLFENQAADKIDYFNHVLQFQQTTLEMFTYDAAVSKAVISFIQDRDVSKLSMMLADAMPSFGVDAVWIYDKNYQLLHHECQLELRDSPRHMRDPADLARMFQRGSRYRHFFTKTPGELMEIRSAPAAVLTGDEPGNGHPGILLAGRLWSNDYIRILGETSGADLRLIPMRTDIEFEPVYNPSTGRLHFSRVLFDEDRRPLHVLSISYVTPLIKAFNRSTNMLIVLLLLFGVAIVVILSLCFAAWIVSPLKKISAALRSSDPGQVESLTDKKNEFGTISLLIQNFFKQQDARVAEINERRQVEQALRHSQGRFRALVETTSDLIWEADADLKIIYVSPRSREMLGYEPGDIIGRSLLTMLVPEESQTEAASTAAILKRRKPFNGLVSQIQHKDGRMIFIETSAVPVYEENAQFRGYRGIDRDITERKNIESQLQQALKMEAVGTLAGGIAHDFNNILTVIIGNTELAQISVPEDGAVYKNLGQILQASQRASDMVRQILDFSRQAPTEQQPVNLIPLMRDVLKMLHTSLPSYILIHENIRCERDVVIANPTQLNQVIINLCVNAAHAMEPDGGNLTLQLDTLTLNNQTTQAFPALLPGDYLRVSISDTGCGIPPELLSRIFDPFFTTKEVNKGTGLGLSVVLGIIRQHGGDVSVESTPGQGSTFHILLPLTDSEPRPTLACADPASGSGGSILAVDDEEQLAEMLEYMLKHLGYTATVTTDSRTALEIFSADPDAYDLVISDLTMPHITGEALVGKLREIKTDIPIIITSGFSNRAGDGACRKLSIQGFIRKPFVLDDLARELRNALNR